MSEHDAVIDAFERAAMALMDARCAVKLWTSLHPGVPFPIEDTSEARAKDLIEARKALDDRLAWLDAARATRDEAQAELAEKGRHYDFCAATLESERQETARLRAEVERLREAILRVYSAELDDARERYDAERLMESVLFPEVA